MATTVEVKSARSMGLDEFVDELDRKMVDGTADELSRFAPELAALANNKELLAIELNRALDDPRIFAKQDADAGRTFVLRAGKRVAVRANLWLPDPKFEAMVREGKQDDVFFYLVPHDHIQSFMTVGYYGPGYRTRIYDCATEESQSAGDAVELAFLEDTMLPISKIMVYRKSRDVHVQYPPASLSVSLNVMLLEPNASYPSQRFFDISNARVSDVSRGVQPEAISLIEIAAQIGNGRTVELLERLAVTHNHSEIRGAAFDAMAVLDRGRGAEIRAMKNRTEQFR